MSSEEDPPEEDTDVDDFTEEGPGLNPDAVTDEGEPTEENPGLNRDAVTIVEETYGDKIYSIDDDKLFCIETQLITTVYIPPSRSIDGE